MWFLKITTWLMLRSMKKEAKRLAKLVNEKYPESKERLPNALESDVIKCIIFGEEKFNQLPEEFRSRATICCETVNGLCYMMALDIGVFKGLANFRSLQFTTLVDRELEAVGFPKQTREQKEKILQAMELAIDGWEKWEAAV